MRIEYTALREISSGHTLEEAYEIVVLGEQYELEVDLARTENESLDRSVVEVDYWGAAQSYDVKTDLIAKGSASDIFDEFLWSVVGGEPFIIDLESDTAATAVNPLNVILASKRWRREVPIPGYYRYSFTVRVI